MNIQRESINRQKKHVSELLSQNHLDEALLHSVKLQELRPKDPEIMLMQGYIQVRIGNLGAARKCFEQTISLQEYSPMAFYWLGFLDERELKLSSAAANYHKSIELFPDEPSGRAFQQLSRLAEQQGQLDAACCYGGRYLSVSGNFDEALSSYKKALTINPCSADAYIGMGITLKRQNRLDDAIAAFKEAARCNPSLPEAYRELGVALGRDRQFEAALQCFDRVLSMKPDDPESHYWKGIALLMTGRLAEGWDEYEWRLKWGRLATLMGSWRDFKLPKWLGENIIGKTILVYGEQGIGDEIMFSSCYNDLFAIAAHVVIECDNRLLPLMKRSFPEATVAGRFEDEDSSWLAQLPPIEYCVSSGSLPRYFRRNLGSYPHRTDYLIPNADHLQRWRERFEKLRPGMTVGISWSGGKTPDEKLTRSIALDQWASIFAVPNVHFINLQYGDSVEVLAQVEKTLGVVIHDWRDSNPLVDLEDFAAKVAALDLVISIDNSTIHMAGALGAPTWCMLPFVPDWRWMLGKEDSLWYPTVKLFRQQERGIWKGVIDRVATQLRHRAEEFKKCLNNFSYRA